MNIRSCQRGMPECEAGLSARRDMKNDVDMMSNCQPRSRREAASNAHRLGDAMHGLAKALSPALSLAVAGVTGTSARGCPFRPALHKKTTIRSTNGRASRGRVMVHRTDITGRSMGQASPGHDGVRRPALNGALLENNFSLSRQEVLPSPHDGRAAAPCHLSRTPDPMRL